MLWFFYGIGLVGALMVCWLPDGVEFIDMAFSLRAYSDIIIVEKRNYRYFFSSKDTNMGLDMFE